MYKYNNKPFKRVLYHENYLISKIQICPAGRRKNRVYFVMRSKKKVKRVKRMSLNIGDMSRLVYKWSEQIFLRKNFRQMLSHIFIFMEKPITIMPAKAISAYSVTSFKKMWLNLNFER